MAGPDPGWTALADMRRVMGRLRALRPEGGKTTLKTYERGMIEMTKRILAAALIVVGVLVVAGACVSAEIISAMTGAIIWLVSIPVAIVATGILKPKKKD